jgi:hypothetical protein
MRRPKESVTYPYRFSLSEEVVKQIMHLGIENKRVLIEIIPPLGG